MRGLVAALLLVLLAPAVANARPAVWERLCDAPDLGAQLYAGKGTPCALAVRTAMGYEEKTGGAIRRLVRVLAWNRVDGRTYLMTCRRRGITEVRCTTGGKPFLVEIDY